MRALRSVDAIDTREPHSTDPAEFTSAVNVLISQYIPPSVGLPLGAAVQSAASANGETGDINAIVNSALAAPTPPPYLSAIPTEYQPNVAALQSAISSLRGVASTGIPGAPVISVDPSGVAVTTGTLGLVTTVDPDGSTVVAVLGTVTDSAGSSAATLLSTVSAVTDASPTGLPVGAIVTVDEAGSTITGLGVTTVNADGSTVVSLTSTITVRTHNVRFVHRYS